MAEKGSGSITSPVASMPASASWAIAVATRFSAAIRTSPSWIT